MRDLLWDLLMDLAEAFAYGLYAAAAVLGFLVVMLPVVYVVTYAAARWAGFGS
jgi:hypothetical protein